METVGTAVDTVLDKNGIQNIVPTAATNNELQEILSSLSRVSFCCSNAHAYIFYCENLRVFLFVDLKLYCHYCSVSQSIEIDDHKESESTLYALVDFFKRIYDAIATDPDNEGSKQFAMDSLVELFRFISSPSLDQVCLSHHICVV